MVDDTYYWEEQQMSSIEDYIRYIGNLEENLEDVLLEKFQSSSFIDWLEELGYKEVYNSWYNYYYQESGLYKSEEWVAHALEFFERISEKSQSALSTIYINYIKKQPQFWVKEHIELYTMDEAMEHMLVEPMDFVTFLPNMSIGELLNNYKKLCDLYSELKREFMNNAWLYQSNLYEVSKHRITSAYADAYFITSSKYQEVPVGWFKTMVKDYTPERMNLSAVQMKEQFTERLEQLKKQVASWQKEMKEMKQKRMQSKNIPNEKVAILKTIVSVLMILYCIVGFIRVENWEYGILLRVIYIASLLVSAICFSQFLRQLSVSANWQKAHDCYLSITKFTSRLNELIETSKLPIDFDNNLLLQQGQIVSEKENGIVNVQVQQATFKQLVQNNKVKKESHIYLFMLIIVAVFSIGTTTIVTNSQNSSGGILAKPSEVTEESTKAPIIYTVSVKRANVRTGPGTSYKVYKTYSKGQQFEGTGNSQSDGSRMWYEIKIEDDTTAWICETTVE